MVEHGLEKGRERKGNVIGNGRRKCKTIYVLKDENNGEKKC